LSLEFTPVAFGVGDVFEKEQLAEAGLPARKLVCRDTV